MSVGIVLDIFILVGHPLRRMRMGANASLCGLRSFKCVASLVLIIARFVELVA